MLTMLKRRGFLQALLGSAALSTVDLEELFWRPKNTAMVIMPPAKEVVMMTRGYYTLGKDAGGGPLIRAISVPVGAYYRDANIYMKVYLERGCPVPPKGNILFWSDPLRHIVSSSAPGDEYTHFINVAGVLSGV